MSAIENDRHVTNSQENCLDEYFMEIANLASKRSEDGHLKEGACIVNEDKRVVGIGYSTVGKGFCWFTVGKGYTHSSSNFQLTLLSILQATNQCYNIKFVVYSAFDIVYVKHCHAEINAILNKTSFDVRNCTIYQTQSPCNVCTKFIIQSGIKEVVFPDGSFLIDISKTMLNSAKVKHTLLKVDSTTEHPSNRQRKE